MKAFIAGIGLLGPGLASADEGFAILRGARAYQPTAARAPGTQGLGANEARRCPMPARYALDVGHQALTAAGWTAAEVSTVFSSGSGDLDILDKNCRALARSPIALSPTLFHNSVHNAVAGYWGIAMRSRAPTTSLSAYDDSFAAGLLEALMSAWQGPPCLLVAYDLPPPPALAPVRPVTVPFAVALAISRERPLSPCALVEWEWRPRDLKESGFSTADLEALRLANPAARGLPLLQAIAQGTTTRVVLPFLADGQLVLQVAPIPCGPMNAPGRET